MNRGNATCNSFQGLKKELSDRGNFQQAKNDVFSLNLLNRW